MFVINHIIINPVINYIISMTKKCTKIFEQNHDPPLGTDEITKNKKIEDY